MCAKIKTASHHKNRRHKNKPRGVGKHDFEKVYLPYLPLILIIGVLLSLGLNSGGLQAGLAHSTGKTLDYATSMNVDRLLNETNEERSQHGAPLLRLNSKLYSAAQAKAEDMAAKNYWSHYTPEGYAPWVFVSNQDYSYQKLGENLATGFLDEPGAVSGWMASEGHRRNLLDPLFSEVGFGIANNPNYSSAGGGPMTIIVAMYGKPLVASAAFSPPASTEAVDGQQPAAASVQPANTETLTPGNDSTNPSELSGAQMALASLPFGGIATGLLTAVMLAALGLWLTKHAFALRRAFAYGETFIIRHPLLDVGLIVVAVLSLILTRTVGFVG